MRRRENRAPRVERLVGTNHMWLYAAENLSDHYAAKDPSTREAGEAWYRRTNSASEALNSTIQMIKKRAFGFRNFNNLRVAILFRCGGLLLRP